MARPKGSPNKINADLREMIECALHKAGGRDYLVKQAESNPGAFMALLGKCLPRDVKVDGELRMTLEKLLTGELSRDVSENAGPRTLSS